MPNRTPEQQKIADELRDIRFLIYGRDPSNAKDLIAVDRLSRLVKERVPYALMLQAVFIWHGYGFEEDPDKAYALAREAAELGEMDALVVMASMHFVGYGCEQSFEKTLALLERFNNEAGSIPIYLRIGQVSLDYFEFKTEFFLNLNGQPISGPMDRLEELNHWALLCKRKCIEEQAKLLKRKPIAVGGTPYRCLPFKGSIGGSCVSLKGVDCISHVGFRHDWLQDVIWFETSRLIGWPTGIGFDGLTELDGLSADKLAEVRKSYLANRHKGKGFELQLIGTSVHRETKLFCGEEEVMSAFED